MQHLQHAIQDVSEKVPSFALRTCADEGTDVQWGVWMLGHEVQFDVNWDLVVVLMVSIGHWSTLYTKCLNWKLGGAL